METEYFEILSSAGRSETVRIAQDVSQFAKIVERLTNSGRIRTALPTRMFLFGDSATYERFGIGPGVHGFVRSATDANYILVDASIPELSIPVVRHEFVHFVLANGDRGAYPPWYNEGLAELLSTIEVTPQGIELGAMPPTRAVSLVLGAPLTTRRMLTARDILRWEPRVRAQLYAQAWAMVQYLTVAAPERARFGQSIPNYLTAIRSGVAIDAAWQDAFGLSVEEFDRRITAYVDGQRFAVARIPLDPAETRRSLDTRTESVDQAQVLAALGELVLEEGAEGAKRARSLFERALQASPGTADAERGLRRIRLVEGDFSPDELEQLREDARARLEVDPDDVRAWVDLGRSYALATGDGPRKGVRALMRARELAPASRGIQVLLAQLELRVGQTQAAAEALSSLVTSGHGTRTESELRELDGLLVQAGLAPTNPKPLYHREARLSIDSPKADLRIETSVPWLEVQGGAGFGDVEKQDVIVAIDHSGSTRAASGLDLDGDGTRGKLRTNLIAGIPVYDSTDPGDAVIWAERIAAKRLISRLNPEHTRVAILSFGERAQVRQPLGSPADALAFLESDDSEIVQLETTSFNAALAEALEHFEATRILGQRRRRILVLMSDGVPTADASLASVIQSADRLAARGISIYAAGLGMDALTADSVYVYLAKATGGEYLRIETPADAIRILGDLRLNGLRAVEISNHSGTDSARAVRVFADGSFDAFVPLVPGENEIEVVASLEQGPELRETRRVYYVPTEERSEADEQAARTLLERLRVRTRETELALEVEGASPQVVDPAEPLLPGPAGRERGVDVRVEGEENYTDEP